MMGHIKEQHHAKRDTEKQRAEEECSVFFIPDGTQLGASGSSEKDASDYNLITDGTMRSRIVGSQGPDNAGYDEHQPPKTSKMKQLRADKTSSKQKPVLKKRQLLKKLVRQTRLANQIKAAKGALVKMETAIQMELPTFRPPISLEYTLFVVKSLEALIIRKETRRKTCWKEFMMELETLNDVVRREIRRLRKSKTTGLPGEDVVQPSGIEKEEQMPSFEDACLYCNNDRCSGCLGY